MNDLERAKQLAAENNLTVAEVSPGHIQITGGGVLVNWYPGSKRRTAYCAGAVAGLPYCNAEKAIALALGEADHASKKVACRTSMKKKRAALHRSMPDARCHWCQRPLTWDDSTVDHLIPLAKGGSNRRENLVLSCFDCNQQKGSQLPQRKPDQCPK